MKPKTLSADALINITTGQATTTTTEAGNEPDEALSDYHIGLIVLVVLILISNVFAIEIYKRHEKVRRNLSNVLLVSLAICDLVPGVVVVPLVIYCEHKYDEENEILVHSCRINFILQNFCAFSTIFHIIAITVEKYIAILHPFRRISVSTWETYRKILISVWLLALVFALIPLFWMFKDPKSPSWEENFDVYAIFQIVLFFGVSLVILTYCYCRMFIRIHTQLSERSESHRVQVQVRNDRKTILIFLMFLVIFVIGWFPWFLLMLHSDKLPYLSEEMKHFLTTLRFTGAVLNPFLYAFLKNDYKEAVQSDLKSCCSKCRRPRRLEQFSARSTSVSLNNNFVEQNTLTTGTESREPVRLQKMKKRGQRKHADSLTSGCPSTNAEDTDL